MLHETCPECGSENTHPIPQLDDVLQCSDCGTIFESEDMYFNEKMEAFRRRAAKEDT